MLRKLELLLQVTGAALSPRHHGNAACSASWWRSPAAPTLSCLALSGSTGDESDRPSFTFALTESRTPRSLRGRAAKPGVSVEQTKRDKTVGSNGAAGNIPEYSGSFRKAQVQTCVSLKGISLSLYSRHEFIFKIYFVMGSWVQEHTGHYAEVGRRKSLLSVGGLHKRI